MRAHGEHVARGFPTVLVVAAAEILAHQHIPTHCQPIGQLGEHIHNDAGVVDGGNSHITDVVPGDDDVRDTINSLQQAGRHQWQGIPDQLARDAALGKILFYSGHSVPLLICVQFPVSLHVVKVYCGFPGKAILTFCHHHTKRTASAARFLIIPYNNAIYVYSSPCSTPRRRSRQARSCFPA